MEYFVHVCVVEALLTWC